MPGPVTAGQVASLGWLDAASFGAIGNGSFDNTSAFSAALAAASTSASHVLYIRDGVYNFSGTLTIPSGITIFGNSSPGDVGGPGPWPNNPFRVQLVFTGSSGAALYIPEISSNVITGIELIGNSDCGIQVGTAFKVNTATTSGSANVTVTGVNGTGFKSGQATDCSDFPTGTLITSISGAPVRVPSTTLASSATVSVASTSGLSMGMKVIGIGIPASTTISTIGSGTVTLSNAAVHSGTSILSFFNSSMTLTLSNVSSGTHTFVDDQAPNYYDPNFPGTNYPLLAGTNIEIGNCYIHGFAVSILSNFAIGLTVYDLLLGNAQVAHYRGESIVTTKISNVQMCNDGVFTPCAFSLSLVSCQTETQLNRVSTCNSLCSIDAANSNIRIEDLNTQGAIGTVWMDLRTSQITGNQISLETTAPSCVGIRLHDGQITATNVSRIDFNSLSTTTVSSSTTITLANTSVIAAGQAIFGPGIPANTWIASITNGTTAVLSQAATVSGTNSLLYIGPMVQTTIDGNANLSVGSVLVIQQIDGSFNIVGQRAAGTSPSTLTGNWLFSGTTLSGVSQFSQILIGSNTNANRTVYGFGGIFDAGLNHESGGAGIGAQIGFTGAAVTHLLVINGMVNFPLGKLNVTGIPTSSAGLSSGDVWSNLGILTIV